MKTLDGVDKLHLDRAYDDVANGRVKVNDDRVYVYVNGLLADKPADWNQLVWESHKSREEFEAKAREWSERRRYRYVIDDRTNAEQMTRAFTSFVNIGSHEDEKQFGNHLAREHRTLQQGAMRTFLAFSKALADNYAAGYYDLRNEQASKAAVAIVEATKNIPMPLI